MNASLRSLLLEHDELADLTPAERRLALRRLAFENGIAVGHGDIARIAEEIDGFGLLSSLMKRDDVTDILVNGPNEVWIDREGVLERTSIHFSDGASLGRLLQRLLGAAGVRLDRSQPIADAKLPDGSRIHVVVPPLAPGGPVVSIRRFPTRRFDLDDLAAREMFDAATHHLLKAALAARKNIVISGRTGTGKSTLLDALLASIEAGERVVTIEELPELALGSSHTVSLIARGPNVEGKGEVRLDDLLRASLRMRPDRIVIGEVRGPEALTALEAMSTGHEGSMLTLHARSASAVPDRLVTLGLQARSGRSERSLERLVREAVDLVVHLDRIDGDRRVVELCDID